MWVELVCYQIFPEWGARVKLTGLDAGPRGLRSFLLERQVMPEHAAVPTSVVLSAPQGREGPFKPSTSTVPAVKLNHHTLLLL